MINLTVNGVSHAYPQPINVAQLLAEMELTGKRLAVECNGEIVPRSQFANSMLNNGDQLEIVVAVGGG